MSQIPSTPPMEPLIETLAARDEACIWHPFTQHKTAHKPLPIARAKGSYIYDDTGKAYLDLIASWWVTLHGHAHPKIARAIAQQARRLEHVIFAGTTHTPAVALCETLKTILPAELTRFFFSDDGSTSVEVALKMALQFWINKSQDRRDILVLDQGYHGDTFGAMSASGAKSFFKPFTPWCFKTWPQPVPDTWDGDKDIEEKERHALEHLEQCLTQHPKKFAALLIEPLVQGSAGMRFYRPSYLESVVKLARSFDVLIIFDEVMTGFGRTQTLFALQQISSVPDIICLSKGLTGGFLPLALTVCQEKIYHAFLGDTFKSALPHGHSFTANPLGCAAALASIDLLLTPACFRARHNLERTHKKYLSALMARFPHHLAHSRIQGTIAAFDVVFCGNSYQSTALDKIQQTLLHAGLFMRPLGHTFYMMPPFCTSQNALKKAYQTLERVLEKHLPVS